MRVSKTTVLLALAGLCMLLLGGLAPVAGASEVRISAGKLRYTAGNESNRIDVASNGMGELDFADPVTRVRAGAGCRATGRSTATCSGAVTSITISGRGGNDVLSATFLDVPVTLDGSTGNDTLTGGGAGDVLDGDEGNDRITGRGGNDDLRGDAGDDVLDGGPGADILRGGAGTDVIDYSDATGPVEVDLDGNADDGGPGEGDRADADVERVIGGPFDDRLAAISGTHTLDGGPGNDTLDGGTGDDTLDGGPGDDKLNGEVGSDELNGGDGTDLADYAGRFDPVALDLTDGVAITDRGSGTRRVRETDHLLGMENARGTSHGDVLIGGPGPNLLTGGGGNDVLDGRFGPDVLIGGGGRDRADYSGRRAPVSVTLDGVADDGSAGEGDNVGPSVEDVTGGAAGDSLTGNDRRNHLDGGGGRDRLFGLGGADTLLGGDGADQLDGGDGNDVAVGGAGLDLLALGAGNDTAEAVDTRRDGVECGDGRDTARADRVDRVAGDCERVSRAR
jgi:Ca2+-binding RTX toxin-like protein